MHIFLVLILFQSCYLSDIYIIGKCLISQANSTELILNGNYANKDLVDIYLNNEKIDFNQTIVFPKAGEYGIISKKNYQEWAVYSFYAIL